ncbi:hypothetical protein, partial [Rathayibacter rathayi]|uniref:hypothetical protein n=1 Tax=Rathayibacter rathayi TaxID=33887 RepID=UPI002157A077
MPIPVRTAASTPSTAAPGYRCDPVATPSTPRLYLSSSSRGTRTLRAASAGGPIAALDIAEHLPGVVA